MWHTLDRPVIAAAWRIHASVFHKFKFFPHRAPVSQVSLSNSNSVNWVKSQRWISMIHTQFHRRAQCSSSKSACQLSSISFTLGLLACRPSFLLHLHCRGSVLHGLGTVHQLWLDPSYPTSLLPSSLPQHRCHCLVTWPWLWWNLTLTELRYSKREVATERFSPSGLVGLYPHWLQHFNKWLTWTDSSIAGFSVFDRISCKISRIQGQINYRKNLTAKFCTTKIIKLNFALVGVEIFFFEHLAAAWWASCIFGLFD